MTAPLFLTPQPLKYFSRVAQVLTVLLLQLVTIQLALYEYMMRSTMWHYPVFSVSILFVALYEEAIFRGAILGTLMKYMTTTSAIVASSILFGLWHAKNMLWIDPEPIVRQMLYTGLIVGPILAVVTVKTRSIWPAIILHQLHNILASPVVHDILRS